jgi:hypothetical protein
VTLGDGEYAVTEQGEKWFLQFGINIREASKKRRIFAKPCLDWSERRYHISGWLGAAMATRIFDKGWISKTSKNRTVRLTDKGTKGLKDEFGIVIDSKLGYNRKYFLYSYPFIGKR